VTPDEILAAAWRVGDRDGIRIYAIHPNGVVAEDVRVGTAVTAEIAARIVEDHNQSRFRATIF
jgi:hypothetical protein